MTRDNKKDLPFVIFGMGCFWGAEKRLLALTGVIDVESGYANGEIAANYEAVLAHERLLGLGRSDLKNHAEVIKVWFDQHQISFEELLAAFWENHNPTQGNRQGNDIGSNYRSAIYTQSTEDLRMAMASSDTYQQALSQAGWPSITTEIALVNNYTPAEDYHQRYLQKHPNGYCGLGGTGVRYPHSSQFKPYADWQLMVYGQAHSDEEHQFVNHVILSADLPLLVDWVDKDSATPLTLQLVYQGRPEAEFTGPYAVQVTDSKIAAFWQWIGSYLLSSEQQHIAFSQGTERPFCGPFLAEKRQGWFLDPLAGTPLFHSRAKFDSGTGWPSFFDAQSQAVRLIEDSSHGMIRTEVRSAITGIHLGHVFEDGPPPTHLRYCINGQVLLFKAD